MDVMNRTRPPEYPKSGWYRHVHHDRPIEYVWDVDERWNYIVETKPEEEIDTRLTRFAPVRGKVPDRLVRAWAEFDRERAEYDRASAECNRALAEYDRAYTECLPELEALHAAECPGCPWDGKTLFPESQGGTP
jgi:hypothetical protein